MTSSNKMTKVALLVVKQAENSKLRTESHYSTAAVLENDYIKCTAEISTKAANKYALLTFCNIVVDIY